jgi:hypothetical protein
MSLLDTLKKNLSPEVFSAVQDALGDDFNYDVVPRSRLNKVIQQRDEARRQLNGTGTSGQGDDGDDGEGSGNGAGSGAAGKGFTQADIDAAVNAAKADHEKELKQLRMNHAVLAKLQEQNFVDPNLILSAGLIDTTKVTLDDNGVITGGLDDQLSSLAEARPYLKNASNGGQRGTGKQGGSDEFGSVTSKEEFLKLSYDKQLEFKKANPEVFKGFINQ